MQETVQVCTAESDILRLAGCTGDAVQIHVVPLVRDQWRWCSARVGV
jgi:hypothetical protein